MWMVFHCHWYVCFTVPQNKNKNNFTVPVFLAILLHILHGKPMHIILYTYYFSRFSWLTIKWSFIPVIIVSIITHYHIYCTYWILLYIPFTRYSFRQIPEITKIGYCWFSQSRWFPVWGGGGSQTVVLVRWLSKHTKLKGVQSYVIEMVHNCCISHVVTTWFEGTLVTSYVFS